MKQFCSASESVDETTQLWTSSKWEIKNFLGQCNILKGLEAGTKKWSLGEKNALEKKKGQRGTICWPNEKTSVSFKDNHAF